VPERARSATRSTAGHRALLAWYQPRRAAYPWRGTHDPYRVLVSEVMLQQTQAARVAPAFERFVLRFPTVRSLADASPADVLRTWGALGYNRRALALHRAAQAIVRDHGGTVPSDPALLVALPGVGPYTAAAVAALGFGAPVPAVDVNVRRVVSRARLGGDDDRDVEAAALAWLDRDDPSRWNQALMDLGREVCRPLPRCAACPIARSCLFRKNPPSHTRPATRSQARFEGSMRQVRGAVVRVLRHEPRSTIGAIARRTGHPAEHVAEAVAALHKEGLVEAGPAALRGDPRGRVRLPA
jgi:A/G-specific adenine glycosylase